MSDTAQVRIRLKTREESYAVPDVPLIVPLSLKRYGLSQVVNKVLSLDRSVPFDFFVGSNKTLLKTSLDKYLIENGLSPENELEIEYARSIIPPVHSGSFPHDDWVSSVAPSEEIIVTGSFDGYIRVWDYSGNATATLSAHEDGVKAVSWAEGGALVSGGMDGLIKLWDVPKSRCVSQFMGHTAPINSIIAKGNLLVSAGADGQLGIWNLDAKPTVIKPKKKKAKLEDNYVEPQSIVSHSVRQGNVSSPLTDIIFSPKDSTVAYSVSENHTIQTWDLLTPQVVETSTTSFPLSALTALPQVGILAVGSTARHILLHDPRAQTISSGQLNGHTGIVSSLAPSPESEFMLVSASYDSTLRIWDIRVPGSSLYTIQRANGTRSDRVFDVDWIKTGIFSVGTDKNLQINASTGARATEEN
ncbi:hypothetical protein CANCADRAFT_93477 [Tortispora caseinolytica NRRL Y-17796]|uniref:Ribosome biogenesis protein YTM1 n=1 Tax=Tortispora caseinolytica NRRL Y-17796 TaxID=767744 RepID=A0A1E4TMD2_9ASCO|nr:hypothetical protein CANCADRAFT_93477 [Tortispora caseinolytica NRRL Y-17796]